jgi:GntR family transcriptional regulator
MITFRLDPQSGVPMYRQIQDQILFGIASGELLAGEQLPTVRALAVELAVNPNTVIKAYSELERDGILTTEQGTGTFISADVSFPLSPDDRQSKLESLSIEFIAQAARYGFSAAEVIETLEQLLERRNSHD